MKIKSTLKIYIDSHLNIYTLLFALVIFSNLAIGPIMATDILYLLFCLWAFKKKRNTKRQSGLFIPIVMFALIAIFNYLNFHNLRAVSTCVRFLYGFFICTFLQQRLDDDNYGVKAIEGYCFSCVVFSVFVAIQFFSYYVLHYNIDFSFGDYAREQNVAGTYDVLQDLFYRTGGFFKEPSWYAAFVAPSLFILTSEKRFVELLVIVLGLFLSTSGLGFAFFAVYISWLVISKNKKLGIVVIALFFIAYYFLPVIFSKLMNSDGIEGTSIGIRLYEPIEEISRYSLSLLGLDPRMHVDHGQYKFFANTLAAIYIYFGLIGCFIFAKYIYFKKMIFLTAGLFLIISLEGLYGRIDFWMMLLACKLYNNFLKRRQYDRLFK